MAQVLIRRNSGPFFGGQIHAEKNQDIEVENDETHWVGHDRFAQMCSNPSLLREGFRLVFPAHNRTETVDKDETITIHMNRTESVQFQNLLKAGARFPMLELCQGGTGSQGLRALDVTVTRVGQLRDGGKWATMTPRSIIAILIG